MDTLFTFNNIQEIKFTKVTDDIYSLSIKSDLNSHDITHKNILFNGHLCKLSPYLELKLDREYIHLDLNRRIQTTEALSIPLNIELLYSKTGEAFTIEKIQEMEE